MLRRKIEKINKSKTIVAESGLLDIFNSKRTEFSLKMLIYTGQSEDLKEYLKLKKKNKKVLAKYLSCVV